jgi:hypothetical protein
MRTSLSTPTMNTVPTVLFTACPLWQLDLPCNAAFQFASFAAPPLSNRREQLENASGLSAGVLNSRE